MVYVLNRAETLLALDMAETIETVERAHASLATGDARQAPRGAIAAPDLPVLLVPMGAALRHPPVGGVKLLCDVQASSPGGRWVQRSTIVLVDLETGACKAFLDGAPVTLYRTAAASAVATRYLAREDSRILGLVGAGAQARMHVSAIRQVRPIERVLVWSRHPATAHCFADDVKDEAGQVDVLPTPEEVVRNCDILCTLTPSPRPLVRGSWFPEGLHVNAVGAPPRREYREIDTEGVARARVVVDDFHAAVADSGDLMIPVGEHAIGTEHFRDELGELITGRKPGRTDSREITLYKSVGVAVQDIATAHLALERALVKGLGLEVPLHATQPSQP